MGKMEPATPVSGNLSQVLITAAEWIYDCQDKSLITTRQSTRPPRLTKVCVIPLRMNNTFCIGIMCNSAAGLQLPPTAQP
jgi:hypothetical protein